MKKISVKFLCVILLLACLMMTFAGCSDEDKLIGKWYSSTSKIPEFVFYEDGECEFVGYKATYEVEDSCIKIDIGALTVKLYYELLDDDTMRASMYFNDEFQKEMDFTKK